MPRGWQLTGDKIKLTENDVERACLEALRWRHFYPLRQQSGRFILPDRVVIQALDRAGVPYRWTTVGEPGIPDYVIPRFFVEVKRPGGVLSAIQCQKILMLEDQWDLETAVVESVEEQTIWLTEHEGLWKA